MATTTASPKRTLLSSLDGVRAAAALAVACFHASVYADSVAPLPAPVTRLFGLGQYGVAVFIVLSGFVLALPVARTAEVALRGGTGSFLRRRARRILPPYFAALALFVVVILLVPGLNERSGTAWDTKVPVDLRSVLTHLVLVQNLDAQTAFRIDGPMWSVATEWQIYFAFPFLLIPLWRRAGVYAAAGAAVVVGAALHLVVPVAHPMFLGLFGFGMVAAHLLVAGRRELRRLAGPLGLGLLLASVALHLAMPGRVPYVEVPFGLGAALLVLALAGQAEAGSASPARRLFERGAAVRLGLFSYSVYLIHSPVLAWVNLATRDLALAPLVRLGLLLVVALPAAIAVAYAFHLAVERRFMTHHQQQMRRAEPAA